MKTTKADFEVFKAECEKWIQRFGLVDWSAFFHHKTPEARKPGLAHVWYNVMSRRCDFYLPKQWSDEPVTTLQVERCAFHEVCHILVATLVSCAEARYVSQAEIDEAEHAIIRRLENTLFTD